MPAEHLSIGIDSNQPSQRRGDSEMLVQELESKTGSPLSRKSFGFSDSEPVSPTRSNAERSNHGMSMWSDGRMDEEHEADFDFTALDDFLSEMVETVKDTSHKDAQHLRSLEKTLESEKRRLAQMEVELRDAKRRKEASQATVVVQKQSKMMEGMMHAMSEATKKEMEDKAGWEEEWRGMMDQMRSDHREMDEALRRKHAAEIERAQQEIAKEVKRTAVSLRARGKQISEADLNKMHEDKLKSLVQVYHQQGQERLFLQARFSEQEEEMIRSKNQSRQRTVAASQARSNPVFKKFALPPVSVKTHGSLEGYTSTGSRGGVQSYGAGSVRAPGTAGSMRSGTAMSTRSRPGTMGSHKSTRSGRRRGAGATFERLEGPLPSPRLDFSTGGSTFVTAIEGDEDAGPRQLGSTKGVDTKSMRGGTAGTASSRGGLKSRGGIWERDGQFGSSATGAMSIDLGTKGDKISPFGASGQQAVASGKPVGTEFGERVPPTLPPREGGREPWDAGFAPGGTAPPPPAQKWHPNVIAFESTFGHKKKLEASRSPYGQRIVGPDRAEMSKTAPGGARRRVSTAAGGARGSIVGGGGGVAGGMGRSKSAMAGDGGRGSVLGGGAGGGREGTMPLPRMRGGRNQPTDMNANRPLTDAAANDDYDVDPKQRYAKLEEWIESKIHGVLGGTGGSGMGGVETHGGGGTASASYERRGSSMGRRGSMTGASQQRAAPFESPGQGGGSGGGGGDDYHYASSRGREDGGEARGRLSSSGSHGFSTRGGMSRGSMFTPMSEGGAISESEFGRTLSDEGVSGEEEADHIDELTAKLKGGSDPRSMKGLSVEARKEAEERKEANKLARWGTEIEQHAEQTDNVNLGEEAKGKFTRDGKFVELNASEDVGDRRQQFDSLASATARRSISWNLPEGGVEGEHGEGGESRPETSASVFTVAGGTGEVKSALKGGSVLPPVKQGNVDKDKFFSAVRHNKVEEAEAMLNEGMGLHERDKHGNTSLMVAAQNGHKRLVKMFLRYGGDPNASNHQGNTSLHFASAYGYTALAQYMIQKGADDTLMNSKGLTCYDGLG